MKKFMEEFKAFAIRGNVVDLAVAVIIGGAFGKIVASLVNDIIMPIVSLLFGGAKFSELKATVGGAEIMYGNFIQNIFDFIIIALVIFIMIKQMAKLRKKEEAAPAAPPAPTKEELLLAEIRDILKEK
ncbi:large-conductance mechanosensitive channel protein MscL [Youngiibacter multivorans]|uniref:Large-conductance mechanosensitive channel n=1 Tax=Youngiibacter multivorans TaxID=937251 RepID=A0ABS4G8C5_9CLOT|nr:large-conductance mechanosensitive channel protein MscL [Youngiibacter multivorans]MBP1920786.1 large conductance mechanosensitive channel [Youngiibacter multivorans]